MKNLRLGVRRGNGATRDAAALTAAMPSSPAYEDDFEDYEDDFEDDEPSPAASAAAAPPPSPPAAAAVKAPQIAAPAATAASPTVESPPMKHQHSSFALITLDELDVADTLAAGAMGTLKAKMKELAAQSKKERGKFCAIAALSLTLFVLIYMVVND